MADAGEAGLTVAVVARRLGVAPATLRSWERRYGVGPTGRQAGVRRRYTAADVARLDHMRRLTLDGVAPADAARLALAATPPAQPGQVAAPEPPPGARASGYGGRLIAVPDGSPQARGLARAAQALDSPAVRTLVGSVLAEHGVITTWELLLCPVLRGLGDRWAATGEGVEVEHVLSESVVACLLSVADAVPDSRVSRPVLLACADGDPHTLPLYALHAALAERGVPSRVLGPGLPGPALAAAVRRTGPAALLVHAQLGDAATAAAFAALPATRPPTAVLAGGVGWTPAGLPHGVTYAHDLGEAVHLVQVACGLG